MAFKFRDQKAIILVSYAILYQFFLYLFFQTPGHLQLFGRPKLGGVFRKHQDEETPQKIGPGKYIASFINTVKPVLRSH